MKRTRHIHRDERAGLGDPPSRPAKPLTRFVAAIQSSAEPDAVYEMPHLDNGADATQAAIDTGQDDARSGPADEISREPRMPNQDAMSRYVHELLEVVGQRAYAIMAALNSNTLTHPFTPTQPTEGWKAASVRTRVLMSVALVLEVVFGAKMAERLAGSHELISWAVGVAIAAVLTFSSLGIASAVHRQVTGLLRGKGAWLALGVAVLAVAFLTAYSWGLGGAARATPSNLGVRGGNAPGQVTPSSQSAENWPLVLIYGALLLLLLASVVLSHLIDLHDEDVARVNTDMLAKKTVLDATEQKLLAIKLLRQCLILNQQAKHRAQGLLMAYVGGVRSGLSAAVDSAWDTTELEDLQLDDPAWVETIEAELRRLEGTDTTDAGPRTINLISN